jgi:hypothetical protein
VTDTTYTGFTFLAFIAFESFGVSEVRCVTELMSKYLTASAFDSLEDVVIVAATSADLAAFLLHGFYLCKHACYNYQR